MRPAVARESVTEKQLQDFLRSDGSSRTSISPQAIPPEFRYVVQLKPEVKVGFNPNCRFLDDDDEAYQEPTFVITNKHLGGTTTIYLKSNGDYVFTGDAPFSRPDRLIEIFQEQVLRVEAQQLNNQILGPSLYSDIESKKAGVIPNGNLASDTLQAKLTSFYKGSGLALEQSDLNELMNVFEGRSQLPHLYRIKVNLEKKAEGAPWTDNQHYCNATFCSIRIDPQADLNLKLDPNLIQRAVAEGFANLKTEDLSAILNAGPLDWAYLSCLVHREIVHKGSEDSPWCKLVDTAKLPPAE